MLGCDDLMKKIILGIFCLFVVIVSIAAVSSTGFVSHDFGKFTMNVPEDANFSEYNVTNKNIEISAGTDFSDPSISHPVWNAGNLSVAYYDCGEDKISDCNKVMDDYHNDTPVEKSDEFYAYNHKGNGPLKYEVFKVKKGGFLESDIVISISGNDLGQLKQMANSLKFKENK